MTEALAPGLDAFHDFEPGQQTFLDAVLTGFSQPQKWLPCKFLYDERGSKLFERICTLDAYYPTRTEMGILKACATDIGTYVPAHTVIIEFGSGAAEKVRLLLDGLDRPAGYVPIDISRQHLLDNAESLACEHPELSIVAVCADFTRGLDLDGVAPGGFRVGFFPGSTIGNFEPREAVPFLARIARTLGRGSLFVIGVDLKKDRHILEAAYDDPQGITAEFNLNLLRRINRDLQGTFDLARFHHRAFYNETEGRIEMHLVSHGVQVAEVAGHRFDFADGETIHTESSYKYTIAEFAALAERAGFDAVAAWTDPDALFSVHAFRVAG